MIFLYVIKLITICEDILWYTDDDDDDTLVLRCKHYPKHDSFRYFFCYRIILVWNLLPESVVSSTTLTAFKKCLNKFDLHTICLFVY